MSKFATIAGLLAQHAAAVVAVIAIAAAAG
jgi:hypothetical protein